MNLLSAAEVAERLGVTYSAVTNWCRRGQMQGAIMVGRTWVIPEETLTAFVRPPMGRPKLKNGAGHE